MLNIVMQLYLRKISSLKIIKYNDFSRVHCLVCKTILGENFHKKSYGNFCHSCHYASGAVEEYHYEMFFW
jgi:hypothetical protein